MRGSLLSNSEAEAEMTKSHQLRVLCLFTQPEPNNQLSSPFHVTNKTSSSFRDESPLSWFNRKGPGSSSYLHECLSQVGSLLDELAVFFEEGAEEQAEVLDEVLLIVLPVGVGQSDVSVQRQHLTRRQNITSQTHLYLFVLKLYSVSTFLP